MVNRSENVTAGLVDSAGLLEALFPNPEARPSMRWLKERTKRREISFLKLGRLVYFDVESVKRELLARHSITGRASR
jgi:hypothetical protein